MIPGRSEHHLCPGFSEGLIDVTTCTCDCCGGLRSSPPPRPLRRTVRCRRSTARKCTSLLLSNLRVAVPVGLQPRPPLALLKAQGQNLICHRSNSRPSRDGAMTLPESIPATPEPLTHPRRFAYALGISGLVSAFGSPPHRSQRLSRLTLEAYPQCLPLTAVAVPSLTVDLALPATSTTVRCRST